MPLPVQYPDLEQMFGDNSILGGQMALPQYQGAMANQALNQVGALQDLFQSEQKHPLEMERTRLANDTSRAQLPGIEADSSMRQDKAKFSKSTLDSDIKTQLSKDELDSALQFAELLSLSPDPQQRQMGMDMLKRTKGVIAENAKQQFMSERRLKEIAAGGAEARQTQREGIEGGRYQRSGTSGSSSPARTYQAQAAEYFRLAADALADGDDATAQKYLQLAQQMQQADLDRRPGMEPRPGTPDLNRMDIPTNPGKPPKPLALPGEAPASTQGGVDADLFKGAFGAYEPDKYEYRIGPNGVPQRRLKGK